MILKQRILYFFLFLEDLERPLRKGGGRLSKRKKKEKNKTEKIRQSKETNGIHRNDTIILKRTEPSRKEKLRLETPAPLAEPRDNRQGRKFTDHFLKQVKN
jgi:hypothetical protein